LGEFAPYQVDLLDLEERTQLTHPALEVLPTASRRMPGGRLLESPAGVDWDPILSNERPPRRHPCPCPRPAPPRRTTWPPCGPTSRHCVTAPPTSTDPVAPRLPTWSPRRCTTPCSPRSRTVGRRRWRSATPT